MAKNKMEDMKVKRVKITSITRGDIVAKPANKIVEQRESSRPVAKDIIPELTNHIHEREPARRLPTTPSIFKKRRSLRRPLLVVFILCLFLGGAYWYGDIFQNAKITITEKHQTLNPDEEVWTVAKGSNSTTKFEIMIIPEIEMKEVTLTESQTGSTKAEGEVVFYNEYSTKAQTISINSFISDSAGKTYKTNKAISIPGYKTQNGKIIPGQVGVGVTAFLSGSSYNGNPTDFTINAFKNTPKFKKIYAKAKTPMTGGAEGLTYKLGTEDKGKLESYASSALKNTLLKKVSAQIPNGYILYPSATSYTYEVDQTILSPTPNTRVKITGTLFAVIIDRDGLSRSITNELLPGLTDSEYREIEVKGLENLAFDFVNPNESITKDTTEVKFRLKGTLDAVWHPDVEALKRALVSIPKSKVQEVFSRDKGILDAHVKMFPIWQSYLPADTSKLHVIVK